MTTAEDALGAPVEAISAADLTRSGFAGGYVTDAVVEAGVAERANGHVNGTAKNGTEKIIPPPPTWESVEEFFALGHDPKLLAAMRGRQEDVESLSPLVDIGDRSRIDLSQSKLFTFPDAEVEIVVTVPRQSAGQLSEKSKILLVDTGLQTPGVERPTYDITSTGIVEGPHGYSFVFPMTDVGSRRTVRVLQLKPHGFSLQTERVNSGSRPTFGTSPEVGEAIVGMSRHLMLKQNRAIFERSDVGRQVRR